MSEPGYWRTLYDKMLASLEDGNFMRFNGYTVPGRTFQYRGLAEFLKALDWVKAKADLEEGRASYRGRIYAGQGGRG
ncbi:MAG: hypothetical protein LBQ63_05075 [Deltaproteobacteria bacterium]|jgi:hypothetical protein|nr:hypothetical protein [Deltaproteobacteria bacterium]